MDATQPKKSGGGGGGESLSSGESTKPKKAGKLSKSNAKETDRDFRVSKYWHITPPVCMAIALACSLFAVFLSTVVLGHVPTGIFPSISWAGDLFPESILLGIAMLAVAVQMFSVHILYDKDFEGKFRIILAVLTLLGICGFVAISLISVSDSAVAHGVVSLIAFFSLYIYTGFRLYVFWRWCKADKDRFDKYKRSIWIILAIGVFGIPFTICCFTFYIVFICYGAPATSSLYLWFVICEWASAIIVGFMHVASWGAYHIGVSMVFNEI